MSWKRELGSKIKQGCDSGLSACIEKPLIQNLDLKEFDFQNGLQVVLMVSCLTIEFLREHRNWHFTSDLTLR